MTQPSGQIPNQIFKAKIVRLVKFGYTSFLIMWTMCLVKTLLSSYLSHSLSLPPTIDSKGMTLLQFTDFVRLYTAGKITLSPARHLFYSWDVQKQFLENITHCMIGNEDFYNQVMPIVFLLMVPYSVLPIDSAHLLFDFINTCLGLLGYWIAARGLPQMNKKMVWLILIGALASMPSWNTWMLGQIAWLYLGLLCFYIASLVKGDDMGSGLALALCVIKPQYILYLLIPALSLKRYRAIVIALAWGVLFFFICVLVFGLKAIIAYPFALARCETALKSTHTYAMYSLIAFFSRFQLQPALYRVFLISLAVAFIIIAIVIVRRFRQGASSTKTFNWMIASIVIASLLFSPHTHSYDCLLLVVPALWTLPFYSTFEKKSFSLYFWQWIFYLMPVITWTAHWLSYFGMAGNLFFILIMVGLLICALKQFWAESVIYQDIC